MSQNVENILKNKLVNLYVLKYSPTYDHYNYIMQPHVLEKSEFKSVKEWLEK